MNWLAKLFGFKETPKKEKKTENKPTSDYTPITNNDDSFITSTLLNPFNPISPMYVWDDSPNNVMIEKHNHESNHDFESYHHNHNDSNFDSVNNNTYFSDSTNYDHSSSNFDSNSSSFDSGSSSFDSGSSSFDSGSSSFDSSGW